MGKLIAPPTPGDTLYEQVSVKSEAVRKRISSSRLFGVVAPGSVIILPPVLR
jgi:hypothetical protein